MSSFLQCSLGGGCLDVCWASLIELLEIVLHHEQGLQWQIITRASNVSMSYSLFIFVLVFKAVYWCLAFRFRPWPSPALNRWDNFADIFSNSAWSDLNVTISPNRTILHNNLQQNLAFESFKQLDRQSCIHSRKAMFSWQKWGNSNNETRKPEVIHMGWQGMTDSNNDNDCNDGMARNDVNMTLMLMILDAHGCRQCLVAPHSGIDSFVSKIMLEPGATFWMWFTPTSSWELYLQVKFAALLWVMWNCCDADLDEMILKLKWVTKYTDARVMIMMTE